MDAGPFEEARQEMVASQLIARQVTDERVLAAFRTVPRHCFLPEALGPVAYDDRPHDIGLGQTISQPYMVALMTQLLALRPEDRVLEVGTGSGYQAAILSRLCAQVLTVERHRELADNARRCLKALGYDNVTVQVWDGSLGAPAEVPFDAVVVTAGGPQVPQPLLKQLASGGRLVCPVGSREVQRLVKVVREGHRYRQDNYVSCVFVPLVGDAGWGR